jgi:hypothetical protein
MRRPRHRKTREEKAILAWFFFRARKAGMTNRQLEDLFGIPAPTVHSWRRAHDMSLPFESPYRLWYAFDEDFIPLERLLRFLSKDQAESK